MSKKVIKKKVKRAKKIIKSEDITHLVEGQKELNAWLNKYSNKLQLGIIIALLESAKLGYYSNFDRNRLNIIELVQKKNKK